MSSLYVHPTNTAKKTKKGDTPGDSHVSSLSSSSSSGSSSCVKKPIRKPLENGRYLCYKCKTNLAICDCREKCCKECFLKLVSGVCTANLGKIQREPFRLSLTKRNLSSSPSFLPEENLSSPLHSSLHTSVSSSTEPTQKPSSLALVTLPCPRHLHADACPSSSRFSSSSLAKEGVARGASSDLRHTEEAKDFSTAEAKSSSVEETKRETREAHEDQGVPTREIERGLSRGEVKSTSSSWKKDFSSEGGKEQEDEDRKELQAKERCQEIVQPLSNSSRNEDEEEKEEKNPSLLQMTLKAREPVENEEEEDAQLRWYVAVSGGASSLSLLSLMQRFLKEKAEKSEKRRRGKEQRERRCGSNGRRGQGGGEEKEEKMREKDKGKDERRNSNRREEEKEEGNMKPSDTDVKCSQKKDHERSPSVVSPTSVSLPLVALHVDLQSLFPSSLSSCPSSSSLSSSSSTASTPKQEEDFTGKSSFSSSLLALEIGQYVQSLGDGGGVTFHVLSPGAAFFTPPSTPCAPPPPSSCSFPPPSSSPPPASSPSLCVDEDRYNWVVRSPFTRETRILRLLLSEILLEDPSAFDELLRIITFRVLVHFFLRRFQRTSSRLLSEENLHILYPSISLNSASRSSSSFLSSSSSLSPSSASEDTQGIGGDATAEEGKEIFSYSSPILCYGDNSSTLACRLLQRACSGDGSGLRSESSLQDIRFNPLFSLSRPFLSISSKEAALYCRYTRTPSLSIQPYIATIPLPPVSSTFSLPPSVDLEKAPPKRDLTEEKKQNTDEEEKKIHFSSSSSFSLVSYHHPSPSTTLSSPETSPANSLFDCIYTRYEAFLSQSNVIKKENKLQSANKTFSPLPLSCILRFFLEDLQTNFPSTCSNVLKTSQKVPIHRSSSPPSFFFSSSCVEVASLFSSSYKDRRVNEAIDKERFSKEELDTKRKNNVSEKEKKKNCCLHEEEEGKKKKKERKEEEDGERKRERVSLCQLCFRGEIDVNGLYDDSLWNFNQKTNLSSVFDESSFLSSASFSFSSWRDLPLCLPCARTASSCLPSAYLVYLLLLTGDEGFWKNERKQCRGLSCHESRLS